MKLLILALVLKAVLSIQPERNDVVLDDPIVITEQAVEPPLNDLAVNMRKFTMNSESNDNSEEEDNRRGAASMTRFLNYPHARQIKTSKREPPLNNKRNNQFEKRADNLKSERNLEPAIQVARSLVDKAERSFGDKIHLYRSIGKNMERSNGDKIHMERSNAERSIGNNVERSIGDKIHMERSIGNNVERSNVDRSIGNNMERSNVERSVGNNMDRTVVNNVDRSLTDKIQMERSLDDKIQMERSFGRHNQMVDKSLDDQIKRLKLQNFAKDKAKRQEKIQRQKYQRQVTTWEEAIGFEISGRESKCRLPAETIDEALSVHQNVRKHEKAANMWLMEWDDTLAELAQGLADTCVFKHTNLQFRNGTHVGQNLGAVTGLNHSISRIVQLFANEQFDYNFDKHEWDGAVGHYLQLVFWQSVKVGCAVKKCDNLYIMTTKEKKVFSDAWYWVCDYWPPSSSKKRPFDHGIECSECVVPVWDKHLGVKCVEGNCLECVIDQSMSKFDPQCKKAKHCENVATKDVFTYCKFADQFNWCYPTSRYYKWAKTNCQKTCGLCDLLPEKLDKI